MLVVTGESNVQIVVHIMTPLIYTVETVLAEGSLAINEQGFLNRWSEGRSAQVRGIYCRTSDVVALIESKCSNED